MKSRRRLRVIIPLVVVAGVAAVLGLFTVVGLLGGSSATMGDVVEPAPQTADSLAGGAQRASSGGSEAEPAAKSATDAGAGAIAGDVPPATTPADHYLVRTGDLSLLVAHGRLLSTVDRVRSLTAAMGGYVMSSSVGSDGGGVVQPLAPDAPVSSEGGYEPQTVGTDPYATLTVRVPERSFDAALKRFAGLGDVQSVSTSSEDVTSQYVDLEARLRHFKAVERRLVGFLDATENVNQMLAVQARIDDVQLTIEQLEAELKSMSEVTTYATLSIFVREKDTTQPATIHASDTFGGTFWNSVHLLGRGARITGLVLTALLPFIVVFGTVGLAVWYAVRRVRRARRGPAQPSLPA